MKIIYEMAANNKMQIFTTDKDFDNFLQYLSIRLFKPA